MLSWLGLEDFRNFGGGEAGLAPGLTLIEGRNGQGKTNLLEAAYVFGTLHPLRTRSMRVLVRFGAGGFRLQGEMPGEARRFVLAGDGERRALFAGTAPVPAGRWTPATLCPVVFSPEDIALAAEGGEPRRRYLDRIAATAGPAHGRALAAARRIVTQRGQALATGGGAEPWEEPLAGAYAAVAAGRRAATAALQSLLPALAEEFGEPEKPEVLYRPTVPGLGEPMDEADAVRAVRAALAGARDREARAGLCLIGPHRDEVEILLGGRDARAYASRGQQRTLALALRAAEVEAARGAAGAEPLLLVDDVLPELDEERQRRMLRRIAAAPQALMTSAEGRRALAGIAPARRYRVEAGRIVSGA